MALVVLALVNLSGGDWAGGAVWALLAVGTLLYQPPPGGWTFSLRGIGESARTLAAVLFMLAALGIVIVRLIAAL